MSHLRVLISILLISFLGACSPKLPARPDDVLQGDVVFTPPAIQKWTEPNGLDVILLEDHQLPLVEGDIYFPIGSLMENPKRRGVIDALMSQLRAGGAETISPQEIDSKLDAVGAVVEGSSGGEFSSVAFFSHKEDENLVFETLSNLLQRPAFNADRLRLWQSQMIDGISRRREDAEVVAAATFAHALYGPKSVYGTLATKESVRSIKPQELKKMAAEAFRPKGALLAVSGDISKEQLQSLLQRYFGSWSGVAKRGEIPTPPSNFKKPGIYIVPMAFQQSAVVLGHEGPVRQTPDQYAISVFNRYFARGGFNSVLFQEVRSKHGYVYSVDGGFSPGAKGGDFSIDLGTRTETTNAAVLEVLNQIEKVRAQVPDSPKIDEVKRAVKQGFVFNFARPSNAITREAMLRLLGYPADFNQTYISRLTAVSPEEVRKVAEQRINPQELVIVVVGKADGKALAQNLHLPFYEVEFTTVPKLKK